MERGQQQVKRWEQATEWPLGVAALLFLVGYGAPIVWPDLAPGWRTTAAVLAGVTWVTFGIDYGVRVWLSADRVRYVARNLLDLLIIVLPMLRPLRLLRLVTLLPVLNRSTAGSLRSRIVTYAVGATTLLVLCGGLAITDAERGAAGSTIAGFGDGLWWAVVTITTVGYGDTFPVTALGRVIAVALMATGIALLGIVTATLGSWLTDRVADLGDDEHEETQDQVALLTREVRALRGEIAALHEAVGSQRAD